VRPDASRGDGDLAAGADAAGGGAPRGPGPAGAGGLDAAAAAAGLRLLRAGRTGTVALSAGLLSPPTRWGVEGGEALLVREGAGPGTVRLLIETRLPPPRLLVFGAVDFAAALARAGRFLGYRVTVCDARSVFATPARLPEAEDVVVDWPHRYLDAESRAGRLDGRSAVCVLTHDAKFDVPLLTRALRLPVAYVGAMGSRRTHADRMRRLREAGLGRDELARLRSPIGLDLGARTPEETALSIAAEIVATRLGGSGVPLTATDTPIHHGHSDRDCQWRDVGSGHDLDDALRADAARADPARAEPRAA
jgi:xanthine dehydrogenase accessory factor